MPASLISLLSAAVSVVPIATGVSAIHHQAEPADINWFKDTASPGTGHYVSHSYHTSYELNSARLEVTGYILSSADTDQPASGVVNQVRQFASASSSSAVPVRAKTMVAQRDPQAEQMASDVRAFAQHLPEISWQPSIWTGDGEVVFEWIGDGKHAVVSLEGDGFIGYTMLLDGQFVSGEIDQASVLSFPDDLKEYLRSS